MQHRYIIAFIAGITAVLCQAASASDEDTRIRLDKLSTLYVPYKNDENGVPDFKYGQGNVIEQATYDHDSTVYIVGNNIIHIADISDVWNPRLVDYVTLDDLETLDAEFCGRYLFVSTNSMSNPTNGSVRVYHEYNNETKSLDLIHTIPVGSLPDMVLPTDDCKTVLVAIEAEPYVVGGTLVDPPGAVGILTFPDGVESAYNYTELDFTQFDNQTADLLEAGVRFVYRENSNNLSNDIEPEYITFNADQTKAFISLQENNAIATVDISSQTIESIWSLGLKNWNEEAEFDASNEDNEINIRKWPVYGMYQPDAIGLLSHASKSYLVTVNEGDSKDYSESGASTFNEENRIKDILINDNSEIKDWADDHNFTLAELQKAENLGRLKISSAGANLTAGAYNKLLAFGARSFSIIDLDTFERVYDSGSIFENSTKNFKPGVFNADAKEGGDVAVDTKDSRSDDKGPEPESLGIGVAADGRTLLFIGLERPGAIAVFSVAMETMDVQFESMWSGIPYTNRTYGSMYDDRIISEIDPEYLRYVHREQSPSGKPLLIATGAVSGTLSLFHIRDGDDDVTGGVGPVATLSYSLYTYVLVCILMWCIPKL